MSYQERKALLSIFSTIFIFAGYFFYVYQNYQAQDLETLNVFSFWAWAILLLIPVSVVIKVIVTVIFIVINIIITKREEREDNDEFDNLIEMKSTNIFSYVFLAGFFIAMLGLALEMPPQNIFPIFIISMLVASLVADASQIYFYRRGL